MDPARPPFHPPGRQSPPRRQLPPRRQHPPGRQQPACRQKPVRSQDLLPTLRPRARVSRSLVPGVHSQSRDRSIRPVILLDQGPAMWPAQKHLTSETPAQTRTSACAYPAVSERVPLEIFPRLDRSRCTQTQALRSDTVDSLRPGQGRLRMAGKRRRCLGSGRVRRLASPARCSARQPRLACK